MSIISSHCSVVSVLVENLWYKHEYDCTIEETFSKNFYASKFSGDIFLLLVVIKKSSLN